MPQSPESVALVRGLLVRLLALVSLIAFVSLWVQVHGLIGENGLLPARDHLERLRPALEGRWWRAPTLLWLGAGDVALNAVCAAGVVAAGLALCGIFQLPALLATWTLYLSLTVVGQDFLSFQWDVLLLEALVVTWWLAPAARRTTLDVRLPAPELGIWLARLLVVKLMFLSGATKLLSFDATWWDLSALEVHYFTQPLPMATSWWVHQLPAALHKTSVAIMFAIELVAPWFVFCGRRARGVAFVALALLQLAIAATGNYGFFNLLTLVLCVSLLDDRHLRPMFRRPRSRRHDASAARPGLVGKVRLALAAVLLIASLGVFAREIVRTPPSTALSPSQRIWVGRLDRAIVEPTRPLLSVVAPFRSINGYGLFRAMTLERPEIVIEVGSGEEWRALEFRYKPGLLESRPRLVAPHQPRLDWQMWFAALGPRSAGWLGPLSLRLLEGEPSVWALLDEGGVPEPLPEELRLRYFSYEFTTPLDRRRTGQWWKRELIGELRAAMTAAELRRFLRQGIQ